MKEYIEREAALVEIRNLYPGIPFVKALRQRWHEDNKAYMMCENAVEAIPAADVVERPQWVSVKDRLPEPRFAREWYLVALESGCVKTLAYEKQTVKGALFHKGWHETASPVTHWMPLPRPPKMDGGVDE